MTRHTFAWILLAAVVVVGCRPTAEKPSEVSAVPEAAASDEADAAVAPEPEAVAEGEGSDAAGESAAEGPDPAPGEPIVIDDKTTEPRVVTKVAPEYTEMARKARVQGMVIVQAVIGQDGRISGTKILKGLPMGLDQQAVAAIKQWEFEPATRDGQPVAVYYNLTVEFRLD